MSAYSKRSRSARSTSPLKSKRYATSSRSRSSSRESSLENPGNNLYVSGISSWVTKRDIEKHFSKEGKVEDVHIVVDPCTRESRGYGFVTMSTLKEADRCVRYLDRSVLDGRAITVEKSRRCRGRTPTPGRYLGPQTFRGYGRSSSYSRRRSPSCSWSSRDRPYSPSRRRSYSPYNNHNYGRWSYSRSPLPYCSPYNRSGRSVSHSYSPSPRRKSYTRSITPEPYRSGRSVSHSYSPSPRRKSCTRSITPEPYRSGRSVSHSFSPSPRRKSYTRSITPEPYRSGRSVSHSFSPSPRRKSCTRSITPEPYKRNLRSCTRSKSRKDYYYSPRCRTVRSKRSASIRSYSSRSSRSRSYSSSSNSCSD